jgi:hypothetical protein
MAPSDNSELVSNSDFERHFALKAAQRLRTLVNETVRERGPKYQRQRRGSTRVTGEVLVFS